MPLNFLPHKIDNILLNWKKTVPKVQNTSCIKNRSQTFSVIKFIYSEKATKFCEIFTLLLSYAVPVKSKVKISQNFVAFSEYMNFNQSYQYFIERTGFLALQRYRRLTTSCIQFSRKYSILGIHKARA